MAFLLFAILVIDRVYVWEISSYATYEQGQYHKENKNDKYESGGPLLAVIADIEEFLEAHEKTLIVLSTVAIALFTGTLWRATTGLQDLAASQSADIKQSLRITEESAKAAQTSADATKESADAAVKSSMPILFPFIIDGSKLLPDPSVAEPITHRPKLKFILHNYGKTPAIIISIKYELAFANGLPDVPPWINPDIRTDREVIPGDTLRIETAMAFPYSFYRDITPPEIENARRKPDGQSLRFYFYGELIYDDVFGYRHIKGFCRKVFPNVGGIPSQPVRGEDRYEYYRRIDQRTGKEG